MVGVNLTGGDASSLLSLSPLDDSSALDDPEESSVSMRFARAAAFSRIFFADAAFAMTD